MSRAPGSDATTGHTTRPIERVSSADFTVMLLVMLVVLATAVGIWQVVHHTSSLVRRWAPSSFPRRVAGPLVVLDSGPTSRPDDEVVVLLHGLGATSSYFGAFYDGLSRERRVIIIDLLGFGKSLDEERRHFDVSNHVEAFDEALAALGLTDQSLVLAAHSMSAAIALTWSDQHPDRVRHVYLWGPPIYPSESAAQAIGKEYGLMGRLFLLDSRWAQRACRFSCENRDISGQMMAFTAPRWPTPVSSAAAHHTWSAYSGSLRALILDFDWTKVLPSTVPVTIFHGLDDPVGDQEYIAAISGGAEIVAVPGADHHVALQHPELLFDAIQERPPPHRTTR